MRPLGWWHAVGNRGIFGRQSERIPAHGLQNVVALHFVEAAQYVTDGVVAHVPHMQLARGVREHRQTVVFGFTAVSLRAKSPPVIPVSLRRLFNVLVVVTLLHELVTAARARISAGRNYTCRRLPSDRRKALASCNLPAL